MANPQPLTALRTAFRDLVQSGLTVHDLADLFRVHPKAVAMMLETKVSERRADY